MPGSEPTAAPASSGGRFSPRNWRVPTRLNAILLIPVAVGLVMGGCNLVGGYVGARVAVSRGARFVRVFFIVVVSAFVVRIGGDVAGFW